MDQIKLDTNEAAALERRDADESVKLPVDPASKSGEPTEKPSGGKKKAAKEKRDKKRGKARAKKSKKAELITTDSEETASSDDESVLTSSDDDDADSDSESEEEIKKKRGSKKRVESHKAKKKSKAKKSKKAPESSTESDYDDELDSEEDEDDEAQDQAGLGQLQLQLQQMQQQMQIQNNQLSQLQNTRAAGNALFAQPQLNNGLPQLDNRIFNLAAARRRAPGDPRLIRATDDRKPQRSTKQKRGRSSRLDYKRVDHVWDNSIHNYKLQDTAEASTDTQYDEFLFHVRRTFDWEGKYKVTIVDIKSKLLRECLQDVIGSIKGVSLVDDTPKLDPNMLFLYLEDFREYAKELKKTKPSGKTKQEKRKDRKRIEGKRMHLKVLIKYIDKDYAQVKKSLYPMLENGLITFDLLWALWKPNTLAYTTTYGSTDEPRVFKVEVAEKHCSIVKGEVYYIEGKYFEFDGKHYGFGSMSEEISDFRGARKITSLSCYPLKYHKSEETLRADLVERGKKFVRLSGVHYKSHQGMAYYKKKKSIIKVNINGRIMVDPSIHRRINPNYPVSLVRPKDHDVISDDEDSDDESDCGCESDTDAAPGAGSFDEEDKPKYVTKVFKDAKGNVRRIQLPREEVEEEQAKEMLDQVADKGRGDDAVDKEDELKSPPEFSDEEYLIASPVVLGFAFAEKLWLEFTVSGVNDIQWNENAYESLVLERKTKDIVKALVESHKYHAAESIDDVIQGKGKGLVAVLHGPPGTGKTLTAEGISELLKCPLYMVSAGELGTDSRYLETELQKILDICHAWGAILLLDEADVFLEKRNMHDIHRNALVSIFLRQLEYFQGILFLTTNRVETFDDAFQSRIHIALRYDNLDLTAKRAIFKIFVERVRVLEKIDLMPFTEEDYTSLAKHDLNGRQIKNTVRTAQALAVNKKEPLSMAHIRQVLDVLISFDRDLRGGTGYEDAMRSYT